MKLKFKQQGFQSDAVAAVVNTFQGQPLDDRVVYRVDPGREIDPDAPFLANLEFTGFKNNDLAIPLPEVLKNVQAIQQSQNLTLSETLKRTPVCDINLDIEMETGTPARRRRQFTSSALISNAPSLRCPRLFARQHPLYSGSPLLMLRAWSAVPGR